mmetsp:Transcript_37470/g.76549  ORF Transcript_37470/g.76549 Transcript_37470/m.76549 type:complete len:100 (+) Transcript_37470:207-506(+)
MGLAEVQLALLLPQHGLPHSTAQADWILESQAASGDTAGSLDGRCDACRVACKSCKKHILRAAPQEESPRSRSLEVLADNLRREEVLAILIWANTSCWS